MLPSGIAHHEAFQTEDRPGEPRPLFSPFTCWDCLLSVSDKRDWALFIPQDEIPEPWFYAKRHQRLLLPAHIVAKYRVTWSQKATKANRARYRKITGYAPRARVNGFHNTQTFCSWDGGPYWVAAGQGERTGDIVAESRKTTDRHWTAMVAQAI